MQPTHNSFFEFEQEDPLRADLAARKQDEGDASVLPAVLLIKPRIGLPQVQPQVQPRQQWQPYTPVPAVLAQEPPQAAKLKSALLKCVQRIRLSTALQCALMTALTGCGLLCLWIASDSGMWVHLFAVALLLAMCATYLRGLFVAQRVVRLYTLGLLIMSLLIALGYLGYMIYGQPGVNSDHVVLQQSGILVVDGTVTDRVSALWQVTSNGKTVTCLRLRTHDTTVYCVSDAPMVAQVRVGQTVQLTYQAGQGDVETVTALKIIG